MFDVLSVGDAMIDAFLSIHEASLHCRLQEKECELCIKYGEKIPVESCEFMLGGIASNVAVGLTRLGHSTALCAEIGDDEFAQKIINSLSKEKIDTSLVKQTAGAKTSFAVGINFKNERTLFVAHVKRQHDFDFSNANTKWVYLSGLGEEWKHAYEKVLEYVTSHNLKLAFGTGSAQLEEGVGGISQVLQHVEVIIFNKEEAERITHPTENIKELLLMVQKLGPKNVVITDGDNGSYSIDQGSSVHQLAVFPCKVVEKTGAGDAYTSGFLGAVMKNQSIETAMRWGAVNAASVIEQIGSQAGLLTNDVLEQRVISHPEFQAIAL